MSSQPARSRSSKPTGPIPRSRAAQAAAGASGDGPWLPRMTPELEASILPQLSEDPTEARRIMAGIKEGLAGIDAGTGDDLEEFLDGLDHDFPLIDETED